MAAANSLVGNEVIYGGSADRAETQAPSGAQAMLSGDENRVANTIAAILIFALLVLILIRIAGLQGMIAIGRNGG